MHTVPCVERTRKHKQASKHAREFALPTFPERPPDNWAAFCASKHGSRGGFPKDQPFAPFQKYRKRSRKKSGGILCAQAHVGGAALAATATSPPPPPLPFIVIVGGLEGERPPKKVTWLSRRTRNPLTQDKTDFRGRGALAE